LKQSRYDNDKVIDKMINRPDTGCFEIFSNSTQQPLVKSVEKAKSLDDETVTLDTAILESKRHKLNVSSRTHLGAILPRCMRSFMKNWRKLFTLTIQYVAASLLGLGAIERAFGWYDLFISGRHVSSRPDRILFGASSATLADGAYRIS
jgi:hypothetical protein